MSIATRGVRVGVMVVIVAGLSACGSPSVGDLSAAAHAVPVPSGLTLMSGTDSKDESMGKTTKAYRLIYANASRSCAELVADWETALQAAHRRFTPPPPGGHQIIVSDERFSVIVDGSGASDKCADPYVGVEEKQ
jgi:hypothetical protein